MIELNQKQKEELKKIAEKYGLKFVIVHGSYATGKIRKGSDLDIAILGKQELEFSVILEIHGKLANIFGDNRERELDLKELHRADPLFRYYVIRDGLLLHGNITEFNEFKAYAIRDFELSQDIFKLEEILVKKQNKLLLSNA